MPLNLAVKCLYGIILHKGYKVFSEWLRIDIKAIF